MNIFVLSEDSVVAAHMQCDQHVVKMPLETAQLLCTAYPDGVAPYRWTHYAHPCAVWTRTSRENYLWLLAHGRALSAEYRFRYGREHKSRDVIEWCAEHIDDIDFREPGQTPFALAMPGRYKRNDAVQSYRTFYLLDKSRFARWNHGRAMPEWYRYGLERMQSEEVGYEMA